MSEKFKYLCTKEEEFLREFGGVATAAAGILRDDWEPNYACSDVARHNQSHFYPLGELMLLSFHSAAIYHDSDGLSSVQITLLSSTRLITIRVKRAGNELLAEKIGDRRDSLPAKW